MRKATSLCWQRRGPSHPLIQRWIYDELIPDGKKLYIKSWIYGTFKFAKKKLKKKKLWVGQNSARADLFKAQAKLISLPGTQKKKKTFALGFGLESASYFIDNSGSWPGKQIYLNRDTTSSIEMFIKVGLVAF